MKSSMNLRHIFVSEYMLDSGPMNHCTSNYIYIKRCILKPISPLRAAGKIT